LFGRKSMNAASHFITEIPTEIVESLNEKAPNRENSFGAKGRTARRNKMKTTITTRSLSEFARPAAQTTG
ncbi:ATP-dependent DNA helicase PcrA, partial [Bacillus cereus]|nr:ATP-dependent DNA helicase PcrA [Bacillus cereus]